MEWFPFSVAAVGWLIGSLGVLSVRGKHLSRRFAILMLLFSTLGAGVVQYMLVTGVRRTERLSAAHLVGVTSFRLQDDAEFIRLHLTASTGGADDEPRSRTDIDWGGTFRAKATDISATLASVEKNAYIQSNYSVSIGDLEFRRDQLERAAERVETVQVGKPRQTSMEFYLECIDLTVNQLDNLAREMRSRAPEAYYSVD